VKFISMIRKLMAIAILSGVASAEESLLPRDGHLHMTWLMAKVESETLSDLYGTATLMRMDDDHIYFVTNAHVLPPNKSD
jgi:hypothetical protein